jgi:deoxyribodipyrimidine photo-lyase
VTGLSPYIRHGVLSLAQVRDAVLARVTKANDGEKLLNELAWRDYWQRVYAAIGDGVWYDREPYKTGYPASAYAKQLPDDIRAGQTGLACIDGFVAELDATGYLHNHARMWLAAYVVHWRRVRWQAGARWFLQHLLDGDPASNNLSWQWIASTFSHKPYFFNRENVQRYTNDIYCEHCPLRNACPFDGTYEDIGAQLFR